MKTKILFGLVILSFFILFQCSEKKDPVSVSTHPEGWNTSTSANFHGEAITGGSLSKESCQTCHGADYNGGTSSVSCFTCHNIYPHPEGFGTGRSENFHSIYIVDNYWDIVPCQSCHGSDYAGQGSDEKNCLKCHTAPDGPEACNTCHGNDNNAAPPVNLQKQTLTRLITIGAHQSHVEGDTWSIFSKGNCNTCHPDVKKYDDPEHIDPSTPYAAVVFNNLATGGGTLNPIWDRVNGSCDNVYCHGGFEFKQEDSQYPWAYAEPSIRGENRRMFWQYPGTGQALCGSCHSLPPKGHIPATSCNGCHNRVVDENLKIVNKLLHINGKIDVFN